MKKLFFWALAIVALLLLFNRDVRLFLLGAFQIALFFALAAIAVWLSSRSVDFAKAAGLHIESPKAIRILIFSVLVVLLTLALLPFGLRLPPAILLSLLIAFFLGLYGNLWYVPPKIGSTAEDVTATFSASNPSSESSAPPIAASLPLLSSDASICPVCQRQGISLLGRGIVAMSHVWTLDCAHCKTRYRPSLSFARIELARIISALAIGGLMLASLVFALKDGTPLAFVVAAVFFVIAAFFAIAAISAATAPLVPLQTVKNLFVDEAGPEFPPAHIPDSHGIFRLSEDWSGNLPGVFRAQIQGESVIVRGEGITLWLTVREKNPAESSAHCAARLANDIGAGAFGVEQTSDKNVVYLSYRRQPLKNDKPAPLFGFVIGQATYVQLSATVERESDVDVARQILRNLREGTVRRDSG